MQAEECSQGGLACNYFCRTCHVGGKKEYKESDTGYDTMFKVSEICVCFIFPIPGLKSLTAQNSSHTRGNSDRN